MKIMTFVIRISILTVSLASNGDNNNGYNNIFTVIPIDTQIIHANEYQQALRLVIRLMITVD